MARKILTENVIDTQTLFYALSKTLLNISNQSINPYRYLTTKYGCVCNSKSTHYCRKRFFSINNVVINLDTATIKWMGQLTKLLREKQRGDTNGKKMCS